MFAGVGSLTGGRTTTSFPRTWTGESTPTVSMALPARITSSVPVRAGIPSWAVDRNSTPALSMVSPT